MTRNRSPLTDNASDNLALAVFDWIERGIIQTRTTVSDALESWAMCRFDVIDGSEIQKLRAFAKEKKDVQEEETLPRQTSHPSQDSEGTQTTSED